MTPSIPPCISLLFATVALLISSTVQAAIARPPFSNSEWKKGVVVLTDDRILTGEVRYNSLHHLVLLRPGEDQPITTLTIRQVQRFFYYDPQNNIIHRFVALEQYLQPNYVARSFYEIVTEGPVSYLRQPNRCSARPPHGSSLHTVAYHYFAYYQGKMVRAHAFEKKMLPTLMKQNAALTDYIRSHRLQPHHVGDQIRLVDYFNQHFSEPLAELAVPW